MSVDVGIREAMRRAGLLVVCFCVAVPLGWAWSSLAPAGSARANEMPHIKRAVVLHATDGVAVFADVYGAGSGRAPVILLFHQAGSGKGEYDTIAPRLVTLGYRAIAIDQRSGGDLYGPNETVVHLGHAASFESALADMDAALAYARVTFPRSPIYAWGSSYSAALVFPFAAKHRGEIAAVLAFSPGEYLADKRAVARAAADVTVPTFIDCAADEAEIDQARAIIERLAAPAKTRYVPKVGIHGSSTLRADRDPHGAAENWVAVAAFLRSVDRTSVRANVTRPRTSPTARPRGSR